MSRLPKSKQKSYQNSKTETENKANKVIAHFATLKRTIKDFPSVSPYLKSKFPDIDISDVEIYLASPDVMDSVGWSFAGGLYIPHLCKIFVRKYFKRNKLLGSFNSSVNQYQKSIQTEDVLVHECLHAISHKANRYSRKFQYPEEEFVYTNCVDFYSAKGMSDEQIVRGVFLPFCINDVMKDDNEMSIIFAECKLDFDEFRRLRAKGDNRGVYKILNSYSVILVPKIISKAEVMGFFMIDRYRMYGKNLNTLSEGLPKGAPSKFSFLDLN